MDEADFRTFLKRTQRKDSAIEQIAGLVAKFETYLQVYYHESSLDQATDESLESYVSWLESEAGTPASKPLWALRYYFDFLGNQELSDLAGDLRAERIKRKPFLLKKFRGVNPEVIARLEALYIENTDQMLDEGRTPVLRQVLSQRTGILLEDILELVKLSDLARLGAVRGVRARLYHDVGLIPLIIATWDPVELQAMLVEWVNENGFDGIAPFPKEIQHLVDQARKLPPLVHY